MGSLELLNYHQRFRQHLHGRLSPPDDSPAGYADWLNRHRLTPIIERNRTTDSTSGGFGGLRQELGRRALREPVLNQLLKHAKQRGLRPLWIKGVALARLTQVYAFPELRAMNDIDLLLPAGELSTFQRLAGELGFTYPYADDPAIHHYHLHEGYALPLHHPDVGLLEVHHRLWRDVPPAFTAGVFERALTAPSQAVPDIPLLRDLWLLSCIHLASQLAKPRWIWLWELYQLAALLDSTSLAGLKDTVLRHRLALFVLAILASAETLWHLDWPSGWQQLQQDLEPGLHPRERRALRTFVGALPNWSGSRLLIARRLAGAPTRGGRGMVRRFWPHPGAVALSLGIPSTQRFFLGHRLAYGIKQLWRLASVLKS